MPRIPPKKQAGIATGARRFVGGEVLDVRGLTEEILGGTEKSTRSRTARALLPYHRWGGRIIYLRSEVLEFLRSLPGVSADEAAKNVLIRSNAGGPAQSQTDAAIGEAFGQAKPADG